MKALLAEDDDENARACAAHTSVVDQLVAGLLPLNASYDARARARCSACSASQAAKLGREGTGVELSGRRAVDVH